MRAQLLIPVLLAASLAANALLFARWRGRPQRAGADDIPSAAVPPPAASSRRAPDFSPAVWARLEAHDLSALVAELRAKGFPAAIIRTIVDARLRERFADRLKEIDDINRAVPWWQQPTFANDPRAQALRRALDKEMAALRRELLGDDGVDLTPNDLARLRRQYGDLPPGKIQDIQRIYTDYQDLISETRAETRNILLAEDREKLAFLERERRADLERLLTPVEMEAFDLRSSPTASLLRSRLAVFEPTEAEFLALYRLHREAESRAGIASYSATLTPEQSHQRFESQAQLAPKIAAVLGPERYADYKLKADPTWRETQSLVTQLKLPASTTAEIVTLQQEFTGRIKTAREDTTLTAEQRNTHLAALAREATARLTPILGQDGVVGYTVGGGWWLRELQAPPRPNP